MTETNNPFPWKCRVSGPGSPLHTDAVCDTGGPGYHFL